MRYYIDLHADPHPRILSRFKMCTGTCIQSRGLRAKLNGSNDICGITEFVEYIIQTARSSGTSRGHEQCSDRLHIYIIHGTNSDDSDFPSGVVVCIVKPRITIAIIRSSPIIGHETYRDDDSSTKRKKQQPFLVGISVVSVPTHWQHS
jgi:hypothetical protein